MMAPSLESARLDIADEVSIASVRSPLPDELEDLPTIDISLTTPSSHFFIGTLD